MYQLLAYFFLNILGFFVFYLIWSRLDRPEAYDYCTLAGLKCEELLLTKSAIVLPVATPINKISSSKGNLAEIRELGSADAFFKWLHATFGPLAAFHWGSRYVVSVGSMELVNELEGYKAHLKKLNPLLYASILFGCPNVWTNAWKNVRTSVLNQKIESKQTTGDCCSNKAAEQQSDLFMNYEPEVEMGEPTEWPTEWVKGPLCVVFDCEVELEAHPIPANIPILLNVPLLLERRSRQEVGQTFKWIFRSCLDQ